MDEASGPISKCAQSVCHGALGFIQVPGFPASTHIDADSSLLVSRALW